MDVAILVDRTRSLSETDYKLLKGFVAQLIACGLNIGRDATHVGLILFESSAKVISTFAKVSKRSDHPDRWKNQPCIRTFCRDNSPS